MGLVVLKSLVNGVAGVPAGYPGAGRAGVRGRDPDGWCSGVGAAVGVGRGRELSGVVVSVPGMGLSYGMTTVDAADPRGLATFWAGALETDAVQEYGDDGDLVMLTAEGGVRLGFQRVAEPTPGKNRVHLDFGAADLAAEVERLTGLGAVLVAERSMPGVEWVVLADPAGNQFCVSRAG